ncbi:MAG: hypothetical protein EP317_03850 [Bacillota bacterium]|nr:MAG: hypothetical protein EP317_03850 [Bacillota bacterium]
MYAYCVNNPVMMIDPNGNFAVPALFAITLVATLIGGTVQLVSNAVAGKTGTELWRGVVGSAIGAGSNALILALTISTGGVTSIILSASVSAIMQTGTDTLETLIRGETIELGSTAIDLGVNFASTIIGNFVGGKIVPTNRGWFQPQKFMSVFTKSYGQKILVQTLIGVGILGSVNFARKYDWSNIEPVVAGPVIPIWG